MGICEIIDNVLSQFDLPYFTGVTDFGGDEPEQYFSYDVSDLPSLWADNQCQAEEWEVAVHLYSLTLESELLERVGSAFIAAGFIYQGGGELPDDRTYPYKQHRYQEYRYVTEKE